MVAFTPTRNHVIMALAMIGIAAVLAIPVAFPNGTLGKLVLGQQEPTEGDEGEGRPAFGKQEPTEGGGGGAQPALVEAGVRGNLNNANWRSVSFSAPFTSSPLVFATTQTTNGNQDPSQAHVRSVTKNGFETQHCEWDKGSGCDSHTAETNGWVALDPKTVRAAEGMAAGTVTVQSGRNQVEFLTPFVNKPFIFVQVQTENGDPPRNVQVVDRSTSGFTVEFCQQVSTDGCTSSSRAEEMVAWWAIDPEMASKGDTFDWGTVRVYGSRWQSVSFSQSFSEAPAVLSMVQTENGRQEALYSEVTDVSTSGAKVRYCESDGGDNCDSHTGERVAWLAIERGVATPSLPPHCGDGTCGNSPLEEEYCSPDCPVDPLPTDYCGDGTCGNSPQEKQYCRADCECIKPAGHLICPPP